LKPENQISSVIIQGYLPLTHGYNFEKNCNTTNVRIIFPKSCNFGVKFEKAEFSNFYFSVFEKFYRVPVTFIADYHNMDVGT
jgi:hypothetical protein